MLTVEDFWNSPVKIANFLNLVEETTDGKLQTTTTSVTNLHKSKYQIYNHLELTNFWKN